MVGGWGGGGGGGGGGGVASVMKNDCLSMVSAPKHACLKGRKSKGGSSPEGGETSEGYYVIKKCLEIHFVVMLIVLAKRLTQILKTLYRTYGENAVL